MQYNKLEDTSGDPRHIQSKEINAGGSVSIDPNHLTSGATPDEDAAKRKKIKWAIIGSILFVVVVLAIVLPLTLIKHGNDDNGHGPLPPGQMNPYGAIANTVQYDGSGTRFSGYLLANLDKKAQIENNGHAMNAVPQQFRQFLQAHEGDPVKKVGVDWRNVNFFGPNNQLKGNLSYTVDVVTPSIARLALTTGNETRFSVPWQWVNQAAGNTEFRLEMMGFRFFNPATDSFGFKLVDNKDPTNVLLNTIGQTLLFSDKYIQMDYILPSQYVYGFGDRIHEFRLSEGAFTMWSSGQHGMYDDGRGRGGLSGVHPFLLVQTKNPRIYIGLFFRNANAMTPVLRYNDDGVTSTLSFITIGGQLEVYIFGQGTAHAVIQGYQQFVGLAKLPPFWALGWQEASPDTTGAATSQAGVVAAAKKYLDQGYPLDSVYLPWSSWSKDADFTLDKTQYPNPQDMVTQINNNNQKVVAYIDAAVNVQNRANNPTYTAGKKVNAFVQSSINKQDTDGFLVNSKQGKNVVYPDWLNGQASDFWTQQIVQYSKAVPFNGLWTTMNEPYGDKDGEIPVTTQTPEHLLASIQESQVVQGGEETPYDQSWFFSFWPLDTLSTYLLPFIPELTTAGNYDAKTLSLNATHINNAQDYDVHSLYPLGMANATLAGIQGDARPFYLTKGSYSGISRFTGAVAHTDNDRTWDALFYGLQSTLRSQMFGMPLSGPDVCGHNANGALDEELCLRWYQAATFFPLARHSQDDGVRTDPFSFKDAKKQAAVKKTMHDRMQYLRLMYTCLFQTSDSGGTCLDPIQFQYPVPTAQQGGIHSNSYIVAGSLLVSPIMNDTKGATTFNAYVPAANGSWVNMADWSEVVTGTNGPATLTVRDTVNVHLAPGAIIPWQNNSAQTLLTTAAVLAAPISLVINRDKNAAAGGSLFLDQGISQQEMQQQNYEYYNIQAQAKSIQFQPSGFNKGQQPHLLDKFILVNAKDLNETNFACYFTPDSLDPQALDVSHEPNDVVFLTARTPLKFSQILNVYYGSSNAKDLNICDPKTFQYDSAEPLPDITGLKSVTIQLQNQAKTLPDISFTLAIFDSGIVNLRWTWADSTGKRQVFSVPQSLVNTTYKDSKVLQDTLDQYLNITSNPFQVNFNVKLTSPQAEPYLSIKGLLFHEYLNWLNVVAYAVPSQDEPSFKGVFGLGQRSSTDFFYKSGVYSMWAKDIDNPWENGRLPGKQVYGVHPFYMFKHASRSWVGVYHNNAQAQDWWIKNNFATGQIGISTIATGGLGDVYVFTSAQKPESVIAKYHSMIGSPTLIPQWALGWNQCKWCYQNTGDVIQSAQGYIDNKIPLDTQWVDIDYMQDYKDFTYNAKDNAGNPGSFAQLPNFVNELHNRNMKFVPIVDAGISYRPGQDYAAFNDGQKADIFMKANGNTLIGKVWPNEAVYPDFTHPNASSYWSSQLNFFHNQLPFDGLWQDMNEASDFCYGTCDGTQVADFPISEKLPYTPTGESLETKSISLDVQHFNGMTQLDAHSLFGALQVQTSSNWFKSIGARPMIISRSSFAGMGKYGSTWLGDNHATKEDMEASVLSVMNMNIFGIPLTGADICGFGGDSTTPQLCARWHAVGAYYPFSRNHRACWGNPQEAWRFNTTKFDDEHSYTDLMRESILRKYSLMRYYYTQMTQMALGNNTFYMMYKPLFFEFPEDTNTYQDIANNVMIGPAIKTSVNARSLTDNTTDFYFPQGTWCSLFGENKGACIYNAVGQNVQLPSQLNESYAHLREGYIVPLQDALKLGVSTTRDLQNAPIDLHILGSYAFPGATSWRSEGTYLNDDGLTTLIEGNVNQYRFSAQYTKQANGVERLYITVGSPMLASNYLNKTNNCSAVNKADYLQSIYVYNATFFSVHATYWVSVSYDDDIDTYQTLGQAVFDSVTGRIVFDNSALQNLVCLTNVFRIAIINLNPTNASLEGDNAASA